MYSSLPGQILTPETENCGDDGNRVAAYESDKVADAIVVEFVDQVGHDSRPCKALADKKSTRNDRRKSWTWTANEAKAR